MTVIGVLAVALAVALVWALGYHHGRTVEQRRLNSGVAAAQEINPQEAYEAGLRLALGLPRVHPNPETAPRIRHIRIIRR